MKVLLSTAMLVVAALSGAIVQLALRSSDLDGEPHVTMRVDDGATVTASGTATGAASVTARIEGTHVDAALTPDAPAPRTFDGGAGANAAAPLQGVALVTPSPDGPSNGSGNAPAMVAPEPVPASPKPDDGEEAAAAPADAPMPRPADRNEARQADAQGAAPSPGVVYDIDAGVADDVDD